jgi:hypothetical protein
LKELFPKLSKEILKYQLIVSENDIEDAYEELSMQLNSNYKKKKPKEKKVKKTILKFDEVGTGTNDQWTNSKRIEDIKKKLKNSKNEKKTIKNEIEEEEKLPNLMDSIYVEKNNEKSTTNIKEVDGMRRRAEEYGKTSRMYFQLSVQSYLRGDGKCATEFSKKGKTFNQKMKEENAKANQTLSQESNKSEISKNTYDLHGLYLDEALDLIDQKINKNQVFYFITGKRLNS